jgi:hypothetical protein
LYHSSLSAPLAAFVASFH